MLTNLEREILQQARDLIRLGHEEYICCAIIQTARDMGDTRYGRWFNNPKLEQANGRLRDFIRSELRCGTLEEWQKKRKLYESDEKIRQDRINWISYMLGELE